MLPAVDGLFFDIVHALDCSCRYCQEGMRQAGLEPSRESDRKAFGRRVLEEWIQEMSAFVRSFDPEVTIFYNAGHVGPSHRSVADAYTHWEIESLPSGGWGYLHFPIAIRYARTLKRESLGMTGKFHTSWGDFHSFKNRAALEFECFQMLAHGAKCSVGDQLHPRGRICPVTYELIGSVYRQVEEKEPWCAGATPVAEIAVLTPEEFTGERIPAPSAGATRILQEGRHQFDFVDTSADLSPYRVAILPDGIPVTGALGEKLRAFLNAGGAILASHRSGLTPEGDAFALPEWGVRYLGEAPYSPDFILPSGAIGEGLPETEHVMYLRASHVRATQGTEVLAETIVPYFNRTYAHFCSHRHTPSSGQRGYPAITQRGSVIYFAHPIFTQYHENAPRWCRMLVLNALRRLLPQPLLQVNGPTTLIATLTAQETENRWIVHLLHYVPERRGSRFDVIEDVIPIYDIAVQVRTLRPVESVRCVPEGRTLSYQSAGGAVQFTVPEVVGHQMVELSFRE
ncbi:MAG: hypothetical protein KatS3mg115_1228 [Candidatus Poribacteria bacterium]|nr:MAG: hypothetical protein KatS3mg115_1228 [Candidatus Poribacteria bacterium]